MSHFSAILVIPCTRPVWQFNHVLRQWHYPLVRLGPLAQGCMGVPLCIAPSACLGFMGKLEWPYRFHSWWGMLLASIWNLHVSRASLLIDKRALSLASCSSILWHSSLMQWYCMTSAWAAQLGKLYVVHVSVLNLSPRDVRRSLNQRHTGSVVSNEQSGLRKSWAT